MPARVVSLMVVLFAALRAGDGGVLAIVAGVPVPEALLLLPALKGLLLVLGLLFVVAVPEPAGGVEEKNRLMSAFRSGIRQETTRWGGDNGRLRFRGRGGRE